MDPVFEHYTKDILEHPMFQALKNIRHHGPENSVYAHSLATAQCAFSLARRLRCPEEDVQRITRAALLHDFFGYDWHGTAYRRYTSRFHGLTRLTHLHGFIHGPIAAQRAAFYFGLDARQQEAIALHMFPLCLALPGNREAWVVTLADKLVATKEVAVLVSRDCGQWARALVRRLKFHAA